MNHPSISDDDLPPKSAAEATVDGTQSARPDPDSNVRRVRCPTCHNPIQLSDDQSEEVLCPGCGSSFRLRDAHETSTTAGMRPLGKFELLERVGLGAFGAVWRARDTELDRIVALKIPHTGLLTAQTDLERFHREARSAAQLRHPGIVTIHEVVTLDGLPTIVSDFVSGVPLKDLLEVRQFTFRETAEFLASIADAVDYAHSLGVVHRDLKPANIMVESLVSGHSSLAANDQGLMTNDRRLRPLVMDFGLALRDEAEVTMTMDGHILGTPAYMSPEQAAGLSHKADRRSDVYSLGVILYQMLVGELPFRGSKNMILHQVLNEEPRPPRKINDKVPRDLETICLKALAKAPAQRYGTARELADDLRRFLKNEPIHARTIRGWERAVKWARRRPAVAGLLVVAVMIAIGLPLLLTALLQNAEARAKLVQDLGAADEELGKKRENLIKVEQEMDRQKKLAKEDQKKAMAEAKGLRLIGQSSALRVNNPGLALLLAIEGNKLAPGIMANNALREAIDECHEERTISVGAAYNSVFYSPDGKLILFLSHGGPARLWDAATGRHVGNLDLPPVKIDSATFSPNGQLVVFTFLGCKHINWPGKPPEIRYTDLVARVWEIAGRKEIAILKGHKNRIVSAHFSPNGKKLVTASWDRTARIWDTATWKEERVIEAHAGGLEGAWFSPDGNSLLTASSSMRYERDMDKEMVQNKQVIVDPPAGVVPTGVKPGDLPHLSDSNYSQSNQALAEEALKIWDVTTGKERTTLRPKTMRLSEGGRLSPAWSPRGDQVLASSPSDHTSLTIWDARNGNVLMTLPVSLGEFSAGYSPDGRYVLTASKETLRLWEPGSGNLFLEMSLRVNLAGAPSFSPNGQWILSACTDKTTRIWSAQTGEELWSFRGHLLPIFSAAFSPDGQRVATASFDGTVRIWSTLRGRGYAIVLTGTHPIATWIVLTDTPPPMRHLAFSPDGRHLATGYQDFSQYAKGQAQLWDVPTGKLIYTFRGLENLGESPVRDKVLGNILSLGFSPDSRQLLVASNDALARLQKRTLFGFGKTIEEELPFAPVRLWDIESRKELWRFPGPRGTVGPAIWSPNGKLVLSAETGQTEKRTYSGKGGLMRAASEKITDGQAYIWDADTGKLVQILKGHEHGITCAAWSPDSKRVLTADLRDAFSMNDGAARIWDVETGKVVLTLEGDRGDVRLATFSPDGKQVLMLQPRGINAAKIWDASSGKLLLTLGKARGRPGVVRDVSVEPPYPTAGVNHAAYSPDGRRIATSSLDKTARIWDAATGKQLLVLRGHTQGVNSAVFSADGKWVVTASDDETARIWDAETGSELFTLAGHKGAVLSATFSPDGKRVATGSADGTGRMWPVDPLPLALSRKPRELTAEEKERFGIGKE